MNVATEPNQMYARRISSLEEAQGLNSLNAAIKGYRNHAALGSLGAFGGDSIDAKSTRNAALQILKSTKDQAHPDHPVAKRYTRNSSVGAQVASDMKRR